MTDLGTTAIGVSDSWDRFDSHALKSPRLAKLPLDVRDLGFELDLLGNPRVEELTTMPYRDYLMTPEWDARRQVIRRRARGRCQLCNRRAKLHVHHRTYERRGYERWSDLIALCDKHHEGFHRNG